MKFDTWVAEWREWHEKRGMSVTLDMMDIARDAWEAAKRAERDACVKACEQRADYYSADDDGPESRRSQGAMACARAIRAL